ncbi:MAG: HAMP domain-containing sensor histidine kinase [Bacteroidota bacterium]
MLRNLNIYTRKRRWKILLFAAAMVIFAVSLWYIDSITKTIATDERNKIRLWVDAIDKKASLVNATDLFFAKIREEERKKVELWANANERLIQAGYNEDVTFYLDIIKSNTTIPVIQTDEKGNINLAKNVDFDLSTVKKFEGQVAKDFSAYPRIEINYFGNKKNYLYYRDSKLFTGLRDVLDKQIKSFISEIVTNAPSVPVIVTDLTRKKVITSGNLDSAAIREGNFLQNTITQMEAQNRPIEIDIPGHGRCNVFYKDSYLLTQLKYFPYIQFLIIGVFLFIAYLLFSTARRSEQNQVWLGMARETAHQLGTPLSSLIAWVELLRLKGVDESVVTEVMKDIKRLEMITERFAKIGSPPKLDDDDICRVVRESVDYLKVRTSSKVSYQVNCPENEAIVAPINLHLFEWVIENLCKNAIDAMSGTGSIVIDITEDETNVFIDVTDTGKGLPKSKFKAIFNPGITTKKVGWGLGLTLSERIIENYHSGRIFVKSSTINKGTTFRIALRKQI